MEFQLALRKRGVTDKAVLRAMEEVPREEFVDTGFEDTAYADQALPIACGQTISQPYVVAYMTAMLELRPEHRVLEIGTGSGYQAAVLAELASEVFTIEIVPSLAEKAGALLARLGYEHVHVRQGDGYLGWPEQAPFDAIIVTAAPDHVPEPLVEQLAEGGRMVLPVGPLYAQELVLITRHADGIRSQSFMDVRFVPMTGRAQER